MMDIAIIGGGIAGLTTALALKQKGFSATVYERADELNEIGAGIWIQPNALQVLNHLGLKEELLNSGVQLDRVDITDNQLRPFSKGGNIVQDQKGNKIVSIHRARLHKILYDSLPKNTVKLDCELKSFTQNSDGIKLDFHDTSISADFVLAADGINSKTRKQLFPKSSLRDSGQTCWRGIANMALPDQLQNLGREAWGNNVRFGFSQVSEDSVYWFAVAKSAPFIKDDLPQLKDNLKTMFESFHPIVNQIIMETEEQKIIRGDLLDLKRLDRWHSQNICLLGDAAHATTPNMGQGAGQGIEDAYTIAELFSKYSASPQLFEQFEKVRRDKVDYVVNNSWRFGKMAHSRAGKLLLKSIVKLTPEKIMKKQLEKLYKLPQIK